MSRITKALIPAAGYGKRVLAKEIRDTGYYDTGNKLEYMKTAVAMAARHPEIGQDFRRFLQEFSQKEPMQ